MNDYCTPQKQRLGNISIRRVFAFGLLLFLSFGSKAQFSLNFECGASSSVDAAMIGTEDSITATIIIPGDTSVIDSILVEIIVKGNPVFWGSTTVTTSAGEVVVIPFPGLITNTGSNEEGAIYRTWVGSAQSITATTPVLDPLHYNDWQSMTTFQVRRDFDCLSGTSSDGDILLFHACDTFYFDIDTVIAANKDVSVIIPLSELGDADTTRSAIVEINYIHNGATTNLFLDTFYGTDVLGRNALLIEELFSIPGNVDTIEIRLISADSPFSSSSCQSHFPFGGDSFIVGTMVVSSACDECCTVDTNCEDIPDDYACRFDLVPEIPAVLLDDTVSYSGSTNLDSLAFTDFGGSYTTNFCDTIYIIASDDSTGSGCIGDTGYVFRSFVFFNLSTGAAIDTCSITYVVLDSIAPIINCPSDTTLQCSTVNYPPYQTFTLFIASGGSASDDCGLDDASFTLVSEISNGLTCPETISRTYSIADSCGNIATCVQLITLVDTIPPSLTCPDAAVVECSIDSLPAYASLAEFIAAGGNANDDCALDSTSFTLVSEVTDGLTCPETITRTYNIADLCGNVATCVQLITVDDTTSPTFDLIPENTTIECTEAVVFEDPTVSDNCSGAVDLTYSEMSGISVSGTLLGSNEVPPNASTATGSFTGGIDTATNMLFLCVEFSGLVAPTTAAHVHIAPAGVNGPVIVPLPIPVGVTSGSFDASAIISDANETALLNGGTYLNIHTTTFPGGEIRDQLDLTVCGSTVKRIWTATDFCGNTATTCVTISIVDTAPPSITVPEGDTVQCIEDVVFGDPIVTDLCSEFTTTFADMSGYSVTGTLSGANEVPPNASTSTGTIIGSYDPSTLMLFVYVEFTGLSAPLTATHIHSAPAGVNGPIIINLGPSAPIGSTSGAYSHTAILTVAQETELLSGGLYVNLHTSMFPGGETRDQLTVSDCDILVKRTWTATDVCGNSSTAFSTVLVSDTTPPQLTCPGDATVECSIVNLPPYQTLTLFIAAGGNASDNCSIDEASFTLAGEVSDGLSCPETVTRTYSVADSCGNVATCVQIITVIDITPPVISCPEDVTLDCFESTDPENTGAATATDNCDLELFITYQDIVTPGICQVEYTILRTWTSIDDCDNVSTCVQTIVVDDSDAPILSTPDDITIQCGDEPTGDATAVDFCTSAFVTYVDLQCSVTVEGFSGAYDFANWTSSEPNGGSVTTLDSTEVTLVSPNGLSCNGQSTLFSITIPEDGKLVFSWNYSTVDGPFFDPFGYNLNGTFVQLTDNSSFSQSGLAAALVSTGDVFSFEAHSTDCIAGSAATTVIDFFIFTCAEEEPSDPCNYTIFRCWSAEDECGNTAYALQRIHVEDNIAPSITCPENVELECSESTDPASTGTATAFDNCDTEVAVTYSDVVEGECPTIITRTWFAADSCGNVATCVQTIIVDDNTPPSLTCPPSGDFDCDGGEPFFSSLDEFLTAGGNVSDNCALDSSSFTLVAGTGVGPCPTVITFLYSVTDLCGNLASCVHVVTVTDDIPPSITCPDGVVVECIDDVPPTLTSIDEFILAGGNAFDNCSLDSSSFTSNDLSNGLTCPETITRTYSIADFCGNVSTCVQTILIDDTTPPSITCPEDMTIECSDPVPPAVVSAADNCDSDVTILPASSITPGDCPGEFIIFRSWQAIDDCGNIATCSQTITIVDTTPPVISCPANVTVDCDDIAEGPPGKVLGGNGGIEAGFATATDNCSMQPFITYSDFVEAGECTQEFTVYRTWIAEDDCGNVSTCVQTIFIDDSTAPLLTTPGDISIQCGDEVTGEAVATDNCSDNIVITYVDLQCSVTVAGFTGDYAFVNWTASEPNGGSVTTNGTTDVTLTSPDGNNCNGESTLFSITIPDDGKLIFSWNYSTVDDGPQYDPFGYQLNGLFVPLTNDAGDNSQSGLAAAIVSAGDQFAFVQHSTDCILGQGATTVIDFFVYTCAEEEPADLCDYTVFRCWSATDECGNTAYGLQQIHVEDTEVPVITCPDNLEFDCVVDVLPYADLDEFLAAGGSVSDNCAIDSSSFTLVDASAVGPCPFVFTFIYGISDSCGNSSVCTMTIVTEDSVAPTLTCPDDVMNMCDLGGIAPATTLDEFIAQGGNALDNCELDTASFTMLSEVADGQTCPLTITRTYFIADRCGNTATCVQALLIDDTTPPEIECSADITIECDDPIPAPVVSATDNCDSDVTILPASSITPGNCPGEFIIFRSWQAIDDCGNVATCEQTVTVVDTTGPVVTCPPNATVSCQANIPACPANLAAFIALGGTVTDNCDATVDFSCSAGMLVGGICGGTVTYTFTFTDDCGNSSTCARVVTVDDNTPPTIQCPANTSVSCASAVPAPGGTITSDNCGGMVTVSNTDVITAMTCANRFTLTRTYVATDFCGNTASCAQIITVNDIIPPTISCPADITVAGPDTSPAATGNPTTSDNCAGVVETDFTDVIIPGDCSSEFTIQRTWTATDVCGNTSSSCLQIIVVDSPCLVDLELTKDVDICLVDPGDDVVYTITVTNDGEITIGSLTITDYIPVGLVLNDPDWTGGTAGSTGQSASITLSIANGGLDADGLEPGESVEVELTLQVELTTLGGSYINNAEISETVDINGNDVSDLDVDSDPDDIDTNDPVGEDDIDDAVICVTFDTEIDGDGYVCPGDIVTYILTSPYNPNNTYEWVLQNGGGIIIASTDTSITVQWQDTPGGPFVIWLTESSGFEGCQGACVGGDDLVVFIQGIEPIACNDHINLSLGPDCELQLLSGIILEGEQFGNDGYFVIITDQDGNVIPDAILNGDHVGQLFNVKVMSECNGQSCWGTIWVEDKLPPQITCTDVTLSCGESTDPVYIPVIEGTATSSASPGSIIGPDAGTLTTQNLQINAPVSAQVTDVNVTINLTHTWSDDLDVFLIAPNGTAVELATDVCGTNDNWNVTFDDEASIAVSAACIGGIPTLSGDVQPEGFLSDFDGLDASGTWTIQITDDTGGDQGILQSVSLEVSYFVALPYAATASDACGDVTLDYTDEEIGEDCEGIQILRTWTATDESGNTAQCLQTITIVPLTLDDLEFPENYEGTCGGSSHPNVTGWPSVDGVEIVGGFVCNIFLTWEDHPLQDCGGGTKIVRTWTVLDWCSLEIQEGVQVIKLTDNEPPVLTCPADQTVGTNPWFCFTDVILTLPGAYDVCLTPFTLSPSVSSGVVVHFGGNNWRVDDLLVGTHTVTWTAVDACGNSSTCTYDIIVVDDVPPVPICDEHTIVALTFDDPLDEGLTKLFAETLDDGSHDNCGPVTFLARRMNSCIDFDWIGPPPQYGEYPNNDGGQPEALDQGLTFQEWVPFACCDVGQTVMVELRVTDQYGNINSCMVEAEVQDKLPPLIVCPPDITVSCEFWFDGHETDGFEPVDGLEDVFGRVLDAYEYEESDREWIIISDPGNDEISQPHHWGIDGWADDNCNVDIDVRTRIFDDCSSHDLPGDAPQWAVRLVERTFRAQDAQGNTSTCRQRIWVVDYDPFYISDEVCGLNNADDVRWPCDLVLTDCPQGELTPENLSEYAPNNRPIVNDDNCSVVGVTYEDQIFYFVDNACYKIVRTWTVIDWCQFELNGEGGHYGYWTYIQVIKVHDEDGAEFLDCPDGPLTYCVEDPNVELPSNNQVFLGESNPNSSACSVHVWESRTVYETCSDHVIYDVKIYPYNHAEYVQIVDKTTVAVDSNGQAILTWDTRQNSLPSNHPIRRYGLPYNDRLCSNWPFPGGEKDYHRVLWSVEDGCGNLSTCEYLFRLEDCKKPTPICVGLSSVVMPSSGSVTIWAADFDSGSSVDDCTSHDYLLFSFSGTTYQPSRVFDCDAVAANGSPSFLVEIWVADEGNDLNCSGRTLPLVGVLDTTGIQYNERNKDFCTTFIVIDDNEGVCGDSLTGGVVETEEFESVEKVNVKLTDQNGQVMNTYVTDKDGLYHFINPLFDYTIEPARNDNHKNGVSTLDLVAIQKHLLGLQPLNSPYKMIAADANNSESVSALDLVEIRKLILGLYTEFPKNTSWRFVDGSFEFADPNHPWPFDEVIESHSGMTMQEDFVGVKVGDVNGTVTANASQITTRGARNILKLQIEDREVQVGETIQVPVTSENYESMFGYQFTMNLNGLNYVGIEAGTIAMQPEFVGVHKSAITMSWGVTEVMTAEKDEILFTLQFTATTAGSLKDMLGINSEITEAEAYTSVGDKIELLDITLVFGTTEVENALEYALYQNEPNPFADQTVIGFDLPEAMPATLTLYDMSGKVIRVVDGDYTKGYNEVILKRKDLLADGAYYYHLQAGDFTASKKMILSK